MVADAIRVLGFVVGVLRHGRIGLVGRRSTRSVAGRTSTTPEAQIIASESSAVRRARGRGGEAATAPAAAASR